MKFIAILYQYQKVYDVSEFFLQDSFQHSFNNSLSRKNPFAINCIIKGLKLEKDFPISLSN